MIDLKISVECPHCHKAIQLDCEEYVVDTEVDPEKGMGAEITYNVEIEDFDCPLCSNTFKAEGPIWEYPEGTYNGHDLSLTKI